MKTLNLVITLLFCVFFINILNAQTVKQQQINTKKSVKGIKLIPNIENNNLIKVQVESISTDSTDEIKQNQIISNQKIKSSKVKMISPTTVVPNTTKRKETNPGKSKYQRKKIKTKEVEDE